MTLELTQALKKPVREGRQEAEVELLDGAVSMTVEGWHDSKLVGCIVNGVALTWPIWRHGGEAVVSVREGKVRRKFMVCTQFAECAIPFEILPQFMFQWRSEAKRAATSFDKDGKAVFDHEKFVQHLAGLSIPEAKKRLLADVFGGDMTPEHTAMIAEGEWARNAMVTAQEKMGIAVAFGVAGLLQGLQMGQAPFFAWTGSSWFVSMMPLLIMALFLYASWRAK